LPLVEPAFLSSEFTGGLGWGRRHKQERSNTNDKREERLRHISSERWRSYNAVTYFNKKEPSPSGFPSDTSKVEKRSGQEGRNHVRNGHCSPEESKANRQLVVFVKVR
jgi:hypothetical protein